ncbi:MAG TPA: hypothetical protein VFV50_15360 [Bdellovibrionales bacterium]|nr:hypothetical protein [Bdellovibrionales bacterium]
MKTHAFTFLFLFAAQVAFAGDFAQVDAYLKGASELPFQIRHVLSQPENQQNHQSACLKLKTLYLIGESFKSETSFSRAAINKDPWTVRNAAMNHEPARRLWTQYCERPGASRLARDQAQAAADQLAKTAALEPAPRN